MSTVQDTKSSSESNQPDHTGAPSEPDQPDPTGPETGTRRVYRGGGWNDFAKNMRSAYRATLPKDKGNIRKWRMTSAKNYKEYLVFVMAFSLVTGLIVNLVI